MRKQKRILHIQKATGVAGSENHLLMLLPRLDQVKYDVTYLILVEPGNPVEDYVVALRQQGVRTERLIIRADVDPIAFWRVFRYIKQGGFDLVVTHLVHADFYGLLAAHLAGVQHLISVRHNDNPFRGEFPLNSFLRRLYRVCDRTIAISDWLARFCTEVEAIPSDKITTVHYGLNIVDRSKASPSTVREEYDIPSDTLLLLSMGRLIEQKGHHILISAFREIVQDFPGIRLMLVGDGPYRLSLQKQTHELHLEQNVIFAGWQKSVSDYYSAADIFVHPSLWEGFGLVLLEAMSHHKPIIASSVSAIPEIVVHNETGLLIPPGDITALAKAMISLCGDAQVRQEMGINGGERLALHFTVDRMVSEIMKVYDSVLQNK